MPIVILSDKRTFCRVLINTAGSMPCFTCRGSEAGARIRRTAYLSVRGSAMTVFSTMFESFKVRAKAVSASVYSRLQGAGHLMFELLVYHVGQRSGGTATPKPPQAEHPASGDRS